MCDRCTHVGRLGADLLKIRESHFKFVYLTPHKLDFARDLLGAGVELLLALSDVPLTKRTPGFWSLVLSMSLEPLM